MVNYIDGFPEIRPGRIARKIGPHTTASLFSGFDLGRLASTPVREQSEVQIVVAKARDEHLAFPALVLPPHAPQRFGPPTAMN